MITYLIASTCTIVGCVMFVCLIAMIIIEEMDKRKDERDETE